MNKILKKINPSEKERKELKEKTNLFLKKLKEIKEEIKLGGSYAKDTWLSGDHDIDIFVLYKDNNNISEKLEKSLKKIFTSVSRIHGSRDYFQIKFKNIYFEVVPVLKIKNIKEAKNTTDTSPLHVEWVKKNSSKKLSEEIRLAKQFCKAQNVYGAETYIKGFSGHVLEVLVIKFGSFKNFLKEISKSRFGRKIGRGKINKSKLGPLIVIDPVDISRNAAAALSKEKLLKLKKSAEEFLKNPSEKFFQEKEIKLKDLKNRTVIKAWSLKGKKDNVGTKLLKTFEIIKKELKEFEIENSGWYWKNNKPALFWFKTKKNKLEKFITHTGPPLNNRLDIRKFKLKHKTTFTKNSRIYTKLKRKHTELKPFIKYLLKKEEIKKRVKKIKLAHT